MCPSGALPSDPQSYVIWGCPLWRLHGPVHCCILTTVGSLADMAGPQSGWLLCLALCRGCQPLVGQAVSCGG